MDDTRKKQMVLGPKLEEGGQDDSVTLIDRKGPFLYPFSDGWVLYHPRTDRLLVVNQSARMAWEMWRNGCNHEQIAAAFARDFAVSEQKALQDVGQVLASFEAAGCGFVADPESAVAPDVAQLCSANEGAIQDCGVFRFGATNVRVSSSILDVASLFLRFAHRAVSNGPAPLGLEVIKVGPAYRVSVGGETFNEPNLLGLLGRIPQVLLKLEYGDTALLAYCHAAAVSRGGRSLLMPGSSGTGKSTLTAFLVANQFVYLADDIVAIGEADQALLPLPSCLSVKAGSWDILEPFYPVIRQLRTLDRGGRSMRYIEPQGNYPTMPRALAPAAILFPTYKAGEQTLLASLTPLEAMIRLVGAHAALLPPATEERLGRFLRFVEDTPAYELSYSELPSALAAIEDLLASQP